MRTPRRWSNRCKLPVPRGQCLSLAWHYGRCSYVAGSGEVCFARMGTTCAICVNESTHLVRENIDGKWVLVCSDCRELPAGDARYNYGESNHRSRDGLNGNRKVSRGMGGRSSR